MEKVKVDSKTGIVIESKTPTKEIPTVSSIDTAQRDLTKEDITQETDSKKLEVELKKGYRAVDIQPFGVLHIHKPSVEDDYEADLAYAKEVSKLMDTDELPTLEEMEAKLVKRGTWTEDHKEKLEDIKKDMVDTGAELSVSKIEYKSTKNTKSKNAINRLAKKYSDLKDQFFKLEAIKNRFMSLTIEGRADEQRLISKMSRCIKYPDGNLVWDSPSKLKSERDSEPVGSLVFEFITFTQGIDPQVLDKLPDVLRDVGDLEI